jgi:hypothetical protein
MNPSIAYAWKSGLVEFGETLPDGAIQVATGPKSELKAVISALARHGKGASAGKLLIPGVPEECTEVEKADALQIFIKWCAKGNGKNHRHGVVFRGVA